MKKKLLYLFTRTPLHVGAGASVGAIDQPVQRERHTGFPVIPGSALKGSFADQWPTPLRKKEKPDDESEAPKIVRVAERSKIVEGAEESGVSPLTVKLDRNRKKEDVEFLAHSSAWLFGSDTTEVSFAGALLFSEARVLAFPIRSAKGCHAWITSPKLILRAAADKAISRSVSDEPGEEEAFFKKDSPIDINGQVVLEDYCFGHKESGDLDELAKEMAKLIPDKLFQTIENRLVILSDGMMAHFAASACEIAQHVRISDETGTAEGTGLFNQENVPSDTLFYTTIRAVDSRVPHPEFGDKKAEEALEEFNSVVTEDRLFQFGADASTGLGFCSIHHNPEPSV